MTDIIIETAKVKFIKIIDLLKQDLSTIRTGRATPSLVENLEVSAYDTKMKLIELATITAPEPHLLMVVPYDQTNINEISKTISSANLGLNPVVDKEIIRISVPMLSEERRMELVKLMYQKLESGRVMVRQLRREIMDEIKANAENEDEEKRQEKELQDTVDKMIGEIDMLGETKKKELMAI